MANTFDKRVKYAIDNLWVSIHSGNGEEAKKKLEEAAADGDGDACYFLGRCYSGPSFVDAGFGFPENDALARQYFDKSLELGSAVGMFAARRLAGYRPKGGTYIHPPYHSLKEIWDTVYEMAEAGEVFCQYLVGNAYYYRDVSEFLDINAKTVPNIEDYVRLKHEWARAAISWYEKCIRQGMCIVVIPMIKMYTSGEAGIPKQPEKVKELEYLGAKAGIGFYESKIGYEYFMKDRLKEAEPFLENAVKHGEKNALFYLASLRTFRGLKPHDLNQARKYLEESLKCGCSVTDSHNLLGEIYFHGGDGIIPDYSEAFSHLTAAYQAGSTWGTDMLGTCYLQGLGTEPDYKKARELFELEPARLLSVIGTGEILAYGLGVKPDIPSAMMYWSKFPNNERVIENKKHFKRTLSGWKRLPAAEPQTALSRGQQWARQAAAVPQEKAEPQPPSAAEVHRNRMEWAELGIVSGILLLSVFILVCTFKELDNLLPLCRVLGLLLPALTLVLYYTGILAPNAGHGANQGIAITLLLSSLASCLAAGNILCTAYFNYLRFIPPCFLAAVLFLAVNSIMKRRKDRYLMWLIMLLWVPLYMVSSVTLLNNLLPPLSSEEVPAEIAYTDYRSGIAYPYRVIVTSEEIEYPLVFKIPEPVYRNLPYSGAAASVTVKKGLLGINYAELQLENIEETEN